MYYGSTASWLNCLMAQLPYGSKRNGSIRNGSTALWLNWLDTAKFMYFLLHEKVKFYQTAIFVVIK
jgi:hypothetical protein